MAKYLVNIEVKELTTEKQVGLKVNQCDYEIDEREYQRKLKPLMAELKNRRYKQKKDGN